MNWDEVEVFGGGGRGSRMRDRVEMMRGRSLGKGGWRGKHSDEVFGGMDAYGAG